MAEAGILTVGHSNHSWERFLELLRRHAVTLVVDVRSLPRSRFNPCFNGSNLERSLSVVGIGYLFLGRELGGRPSDPFCHRDGRVSYSRLARTPSFREGLARLLSLRNSHRIACLCAEKDLLDCHRCLLIAPELVKKGVDVGHILGDGKLESHAAAMDRLLRLNGTSQAVLFSDHDKVVAEALERRAGRVAWRPG